MSEQREKQRAPLLFNRFLNLKMKSMVFEDSVFEECYFEDITSTHTFFRNCTFIASLFYNTGKYKQKSSRVWQPECYRITF